MDPPPADAGTVIVIVVVPSAPVCGTTVNVHVGAPPDNCRCAASLATTATLLDVAVNAVQSVVPSPTPKLTGSGVFFAVACMGMAAIDGSCSTAPISTVRTVPASGPSSRRG